MKPATRAALGRWALVVPGALVLFFLVAPVIAVIPMSFGTSANFELLPSNPGLGQYRKFFASSDWMDALWNSFRVALGTTVVSTIVGVLAALGLARLSQRARAPLEAILILPRIVPTVVFAVAAYSVYLEFGLVGTIAGLVLAHSILAIPFVVVFVGSALRSFDWTQVEASRSLGGSAVPTFFRVIFPQVRLSILGSALFAFNLSFDEVVVTLFISGIHSKTLPVKVWDAIQYEFAPILPAISTLVILTTLLLLVPILLAGRRGAINSSRG